MPGPYTKLDAQQVLKQSFDEANSRLRVDAEVSATIGNVNVIIDAASGDNIKISDGVDTLAVNPDGSINVNIGDISIDQATDSIKIGDGTDLLSINSDGSLNAISGGTEDGTFTGVKHALVVDSNLNLRVFDQDAVTALNGMLTVISAGTLKVDDDQSQVILNNILTTVSGTLKVDDDQTQTLLEAIQTVLSGTLKVDDDQTQVILNDVVAALSATLNVSDSVLADLITITNSLLTSIKTQLESGTLKVDDDQTQAVLNDILLQLQASTGGLVVGTEDGSPTGTQHVFVNNFKNMVLATHDRSRNIAYLDMSNRKLRRVDKFEYTSPTFPGLTIKRQFNYTLAANEYILTNDTWSII